jgi:hypothetical protein
MRSPSPICSNTIVDIAASHVGTGRVGLPGYIAAARPRDRGVCWMRSSHAAQDRSAVPMTDLQQREGRDGVHDALAVLIDIGVAHQHVRPACAPARSRSSGPHVPPLGTRSSADWSRGPRRHWYECARPCPWPCPPAWPEPRHARCPPGSGVGARPEISAEHAVLGGFSPHSKLASKTDHLAALPVRGQSRRRMAHRERRSPRRSGAAPRFGPVTSRRSIIPFVFRFRRAAE